MTIFLLWGILREIAPQEKASSRRAVSRWPGAMGCPLPAETCRVQNLVFFSRGLGRHQGRLCPSQACLGGNRCALP